MLNTPCGNELFVPKRIPDNDTADRGIVVSAAGDNFRQGSLKSNPVFQANMVQVPLGYPPEKTSQALQK